MKSPTAQRIHSETPQEVKEKAINYSYKLIMENKVYAFVYSSCIHEEGAVTQSLHWTRKGAEIAMEFHKENARKEFEELSKQVDIEEYGFKFGEHEYWGVREEIIQD